MAETEERPDIKIDGNVATWEMKLEGDISGTYMGVFRFRCYLTPLQQIAAGREERGLMGSNIAVASEHERFLAFALTQLKYRVISAPPFWASANPNGDIPGDIPDEDVIAKILDAAVIAEKKYKDGLKARKDEALQKAKRMIEKIEQQDKAESKEEPSEE